MNEEEIKQIAEATIEWLYSHKYISEQVYGHMPASLAEDIAGEIIANQ